MKKNHYKIIISSFIVGIIILTVAMFADQSSDLAFNSNSQLASTGQLAQSGGSIQGQVEAVNVDGSESGTESEGSGSYQPISGIDFEAAKTGQASNSDFIALLRTIFNWGIAIVIILATLAVVIGSVQYMTTDAVFDKTEGKKRIQSAIGGLILALISWLILFTINENIFSSNFLLKLNQLEENNTVNSDQSENGGVEAVDPQEEYIKNGNEADLAMATAEVIKKEREGWVKIKDECFDSDGNYIDPPINKNLCGSIFIKTAGISGVEESIKVASEKEIELYNRAKELYERNIELSNNSNLEPKVQEINDKQNEVKNVINDIENNPSNNTTGSTNNTTGSNYSNNTNSGTLTINDLIRLNDQNDTSNTENNPDLYEPNLDDEDLNILAFQDKAFENIFVKNEGANILNLSEGLENTLLIFRDTCCGGKTTINGIETFKNSFNVSDIYTSDNSFLIEKSFTNGYGANSWNSLNQLVISNTYPDQNLLDITEYLDCVDARSRWTRWSCNRPDDYRDIRGRYYNKEKKGVYGEDLVNEKVYFGNIKGLGAEFIKGNNSWVIKNI